ncbi:basic amino acid ABC transporter substrate-binding protein [Propionispora vibrioides]|uniref:Polar amino acid transport system substrate-binding protein n=1 Tax=Propionispora vibrioides TaxID=112903 RepID=A0A1H8RVV5_9FIRM|nr:basic amino acid ABC transporter substrate-binding protein [Propionispora vibrioides]SEO70314.1 polar amino acid transport system substrate-binding protein [Propionispora vibrioides]
MSKKTIVYLVVAALVALFGLAGCGGQKPAANEGKATVLKVGTEPSFAPFEFQDEKSKDYVGFDMDLIRAIGKQMGAEVEIQSMGFDGLIPALEAGNIDVAVSGMTITEERAQKVNFSKPYYKSGLTVVVKTGNNTIKGFGDLEGKKIGAQIGTTGAEEAKKIKNAQVREFNTPPEAFMELKAGGVDAVINDKPVNDYFMKETGSKDAQQVGEPLTAEDYGIAMSKKNTELADKINKALDELKQNGEYDKIYEKWFGKKP